MRVKDLILGALLASLVAVPAGAEEEQAKGGSESVKKGVAKSKSDKKIERGARLFETHCASCHVSGGNSVTRSKPVKGSHVLATFATFKSYLNEPVGNMPHYEHLIEDEKMLADLYAYAKSLDNKSDEKSKKAMPTEKVRKSEPADKAKTRKSNK